jgi:hypothetical protein
MESRLQLIHIERSIQGMWDLCTLEVLKLAASIVTPLVIAFFGYIINKTIQRQIAITQRKSSWLTKWADDFLKAASGFNEAAGRFMWLYVSPEWEATRNLPGAVEAPKLQMDEIYKASLALNRRWVEISMFAGFAPTNGKRLTKAASDLLSETASWIKNGESNVTVFLQKQREFNENVRKMHAELMGLND